MKGIIWIKHSLAASDGSCAYPLRYVKQVHDRIVSTGRDVSSSGILSYRNTASHVSSWVLLYRQTGVVENA